MEPIARQNFCDRMALNVAEVGFVTRDDGVWGCSPDGLVLCRSDQKVLGGLELKCPDGPKHLEHLDNGKLPAEYMQQVHCSMAVTGLDHWYFMSFCEFYEPFILRIERDEFTDKVEDAMNRFQAFYQTESERLLNFKLKEIELL